MRTAISADFAGIATSLRLCGPLIEAGKHFPHGVNLAHVVTAANAMPMSRRRVQSASSPDHDPTGLATNDTPLTS